MAPESIHNAVPAGGGQRVDLFALGVLGFELLTGRLPFAGETVAQILERQQSGPPPRVLALRPDTPAALAALIEALLARAPEDRPPSAEAVLWQLRSIDASTPAERTLARLDVLIAGHAPETAVALRLLVAHTAADAQIRDALTADEALAVIRARPPRLLLLDLDLPGMNAVELCMLLRGEGLADRCTLAVVGDGARRAERALLENLGVTQFVDLRGAMEPQVKPVVARARARLGSERNARSPRASSARSA
jgi:serine/threonine-protein kinase